MLFADGRTSKDFEGTTGGLDVAFKNMIYDFYSREFSKKQRIAWRRMAEKGEYNAPNIMEEKLKLERSFSEEYRELYCQLHESISDLVWYIRQQSIPNDKNRTKKKQKKKK